MSRYYFDHNATTPVFPEALHAHSEALSRVFGNASSIHQYGQAAKQALEAARLQIAGLLGCSAKEIVFTSGGTESNNLALFGAVRACKATHIITSTIEHPAVLNVCAELERDGVQVSYVAPDESGVVSPDDVRRALRPDTALVSVMHVNNELGTVQPIEEIAAVAHTAGAVMHSDGVQAAGRIPARPGELGVDLYSLSAHKMYAPKGVGALFVRSGTALEPILYGGKHERQRRAGTENVPGASAFAAAAAWAREHAPAESERLQLLRDRLERGILQQVPDAVINGASAARVGNTSNIRFDEIEGEAIVIGLDLKGFAISSGSACSSGAVEPSHVLTAIGLSRQQAKSSVRFSLGRGNTVEQVDELVMAVAATVSHLRRLSPTYAHA